MAASRNEALLSWLALLGRIVVGGTFVLAATLKLMSPIENFEAAVRAFQIVPAVLERPIALVLPWIELLAGTFCILGLYTRLSAFILTVLLLGFMAGLGWVKTKGIDLAHCGCFSRWDFIQSPGLLLLRDAVLVALALPILRKQRFRFAIEEYVGKR